MKKLLRFVGILLLTLIAIFLVLGLVGPKEMTVTRTVLIKGTREAVWNQIVLFKNWPNWSPWIELDPNTALTYTGTDGQPGSAYHWIGSKDKNTGEGDMTNKGVSGNTMQFEVHFLKPMDNTATGTLSATDTAGMTQATWVFNIHLNFMFRGFAVIMNMEKTLGDEFQRGLNNMKKYVEAHPAQPVGSIMETTYPGKLFAGVRAKTPWATMDQFFKAKYADASLALGKHMNGPAASITYEWDTVRKEADMAAVFPVSDSTTKIKGMSYIYVPAGKAVAYTLTGPYSGERAAHYNILSYVFQKGLTPLMVVEEYEKGPMTEVDSNKWETKIYYLVQ